MYIPNMALGLTGEVIVSAKELVFALTEVMVMLETFKTCFSWCAQNRCVEQMCRRFGNIFQQQILNHKFVLNVQRFLSSIYVSLIPSKNMLRQYTWEELKMIRTKIWMLKDFFLFFILPSSFDQDIFWGWLTCTLYLFFIIFCITWFVSNCQLVIKGQPLTGIWSSKSIFHLCSTAQR